MHQVQIRNTLIIISPHTFCYIKDNVDACYAAFKNDLYVNDVVNIGGGNELSVLELAKIVINVTGSNSNIIHLPALDEGDMTRRLPDTSKMKTLLNREVTPLEEGLEKVIQQGQFISLIK